MRMRHYIAAFYVEMDAGLFSLPEFFILLGTVSHSPNIINIGEDLTNIKMRWKVVGNMKIGCNYFVSLYLKKNGIEKLVLGY